MISKYKYSLNKIISLTTLTIRVKESFTSRVMKKTSFHFIKEKNKIFLVESHEKNSDYKNASSFRFEIMKKNKRMEEQNYFKALLDHIF